MLIDSVYPEQSAAKQLLAIVDRTWPGAHIYMDPSWVKTCEANGLDHLSDLFRLFTEHGEPGMAEGWMFDLIFPHPVCNWSLVPIFYAVHPKQVARFETWLKVLLLPVNPDDKPPCTVIFPILGKMEDADTASPQFKGFVKDAYEHGEGRIREIWAGARQKNDPMWEEWLKRWPGQRKP